MRTSTTRWARLATVAAGPAAVLLAGGLIWQASTAAFTAQTRNSGNAWSTGLVALTDDDAGSARFQVTNMLPGQTDTKCITVTANSTNASVVKGYFINPVVSGKGLENYIKLSIDFGAGGSFASCTGFVSEGNLFTGAPLAVLSANYYDWAHSAGGWNVAPGTFSRTYRVTWAFDAASLTQAQLDSLQGASTGLDIQWEMQNT